MTPYGLGLALGILLSIACDPTGYEGSAAALTSAGPTAAPLSRSGAPELPQDARTPPSAPSAPERDPPLRVSPKVLAVSWPTYLGRRVLLACRPVRRIDFVRTLVVADGTRFVVTGSPTTIPCGFTTSTFTVVGVTTVAIAGRTLLPALVLEEDGQVEGPR